MWHLILQIVAGVLGIWLSTKLVPHVQFTGPFLTLVFAGVVLGVLNFFIRPVLKTIALPLRIITLNLFTLIINMAIVWVVDILFPELIIAGIMPLFWTSLIIWGIGFLLIKWLP